MGKFRLNEEESRLFLGILEERFFQHPTRHIGVDWQDIRRKLESEQKKIWSLKEMDITGGEPDVSDYDVKKKVVTFMDFSTETPKGRRSLCYDRKALASRKKHQPKNSVMDMVQEMGVELLSETDYRFLQSIEKIDTKTSSWILTPSEIRSLGGALFGDNRYEKVFIYHNGADSYYASRGFRAKLVF